MAKVPAGHRRGEEALFFDELRRGRIVFQLCHGCGAAIWYLRTVCPNCMESDLRVEYSAGVGTVYSLTTLYRPGNPARADDIPYTVALVDLDEGIRLVGDLRADAAAMGIGARVTARAAEDGVTFEPAELR